MEHRSLRTQGGRNLQTGGERAGCRGLWPLRPPPHAAEKLKAKHLAVFSNWTFRSLRKKEKEKDPPALSIREHGVSDKLLREERKALSAFPRSKVMLAEPRGAQ